MLSLFSSVDGIGIQAGNRVGGHLLPRNFEFSISSSLQAMGSRLFSKDVVLSSFSTFSRSGFISPSKWTELSRSLFVSRLRPSGPISRAEISPLRILSASAAAASAFFEDAARFSL